jgi:hypothetical protein
MSGGYGGWNGSRDFPGEDGEDGEGKGGGIAWDSYSDSFMPMRDPCESLMEDSHPRLSTLYLGAGEGAYATF